MEDRGIFHGLGRSPGASSPGASSPGASSMLGPAEAWSLALLPRLQVVLGAKCLRHPLHLPVRQQGADCEARLFTESSVLTCSFTLLHGWDRARAWDPGPRL